MSAHEMLERAADACSYTAAHGLFGDKQVELVADATALRELARLVRELNLTEGAATLLVLSDTPSSRALTNLLRFLRTEPTQPTGA